MRTCTKKHQTIAFEGDTCPLCKEMGTTASKLKAWNNLYLDLESLKASIGEILDTVNETLPYEEQEQDKK